MPGLAMLRAYRPALLGKDLVAGLVVTTLLVPQGMAYAELAGLPVITGLYTTVLALIGYAVFGPSRILVLGPDSSLGPMIAATLVPLVAADGSSQTAIAYASRLPSWSARSRCSPACSSSASSPIFSRSRPRSAT